MNIIEPTLQFLERVFSLEEVSDFDQLEIIKAFVEITRKMLGELKNE